MNFDEVVNFDGYAIYLAGQFELYLLVLIMVEYI